MDNSILYLECNTGISGDMFVAALLDLGADAEVLNKVLAGMPVNGFKTVISKVKKSGLDVMDFDVILDNKYENHDHDMDYLYGHAHEDGHEHSHEHAHEDGHEHSHEHAHKDGHEHSHGHHHECDHEQDHNYEHHHEHRGINEIRNILNNTKMTDNARNIANNIFDILAKAEAKAHGTTVDEVHFHEVGAVDSIVDIISAAVCIDNLGIKECIIPFICEGIGTVRCQHGILPVPVPAVVNIVQDKNLIMNISNVKGELITPTGAAIAGAICTGNILPEKFAVKKIGMGAGKRKYERPSILRAMIIEKCEDTKGEELQTEESKIEFRSDNKNDDFVYKLETNIDDCTGEALGFVMERLLHSGARDVHYMPVFMKKNRPAYQLNVICDKDNVTNLEKIIFEETTTIGIRRVKMERTILPREIITVSTSIGEAKVKVCDIDGVKRYYPEYESVVKLCRDNNMTYQEVFEIVRGAV